MYNDLSNSEAVFRSQKTLKRLHGVQGVEGSNPFTPTNLKSLQDVCLEGFFVLACIDNGARMR